MKKHEREDDDSGESGQGSQSGSGGQGGSIEFHDFIGTSSKAREGMPVDEQKRMLWKHGELSENNIKKQKATREGYKNKREKILGAHRAGKEMGMDSGTKPHPVLSQKFSGQEPKVSADPHEHQSETNNEKKEELKLQKQPTPQNVPRPSSTPRPSPF